ncbi:MAG: hypothetical protein WCA97_03475 [Terriglobales bacterium]
MKKYTTYIPTVMLLLAALANVATPAIAAFWMNHASVAAILSPLAVIVAHWLPSPYAGVTTESPQAASPHNGIGKP